jgi:hypothetical protein
LRPGAPLREAPSKDRAAEGRPGTPEREEEGRADGRDDEPVEGRPDEGRAEGRAVPRDAAQAAPRDGAASSPSPRYAARSLRGAPLVPDVRDVRAAGAPGRAERVGRSERLEPPAEDLVSVRLVRAGRAVEELRLDEVVRLDEVGRAGRPVAARAGRAPPFLGSSSSERQAPAARLGESPLLRPLGAPGRPVLPLPLLDPPPEADPPRAEGARRDGRGESAGI